MDFSAERLKKDGFVVACNSEFLISMIDQPIVALALQLAELRSRPAPPGFEQFSLLFQGPAEPALEQGIYRFQHAKLGELDLFMVPVARNREGIQYEVCISRSTEYD